MKGNNYLARLVLFLKEIDWKLLLFLVVILNVKIQVKIVAIILIYLIQRDFKFNLKINQPRLPLFYVAMPIIAVINWILNSGYNSLNGTLAFALGLIFWLMCLLTIHQLKIFTEKNSSTTIHNTICLFFIINIAASILNYFSIVIETGALNPFHFRGLNEKYFISTGDYIRGIAFDTSLTNSVISAVAIIYFLKRNNGILACISMVILLMTGSNAMNILLSIVLIYTLILQSTNIQKKIIALCFLLLFLFNFTISSENAGYVNKFASGISTNSKPLTFIDIDTLTSINQIPLPSFAKNRSRKGLPGKVQAFIQTISYFKKNPNKILNGAGMGNFSSRLAFRTTALGIDGIYPKRFLYINHDFKVNHLALFISYFMDRPEFHSITNRPNSIYDQILSEYGLLGLISFLLLYVRYFFPLIIMRYSYSFPLILLMVAVFALDYWFEQLSVLIIVELLLLLAMKDSKDFIRNKKYE